MQLQPWIQTHNMEKYGGQWGLTGQRHSLKYNIEMYTETVQQITKVLQQAS